MSSEGESAPPPTCTRGMNQERRRTSAPCRAAASTLGICLLYVQNSQVNQSTNPTPITTTKPPLGRRPPSTQPNQLATASIDRHTHQPPHGTSPKKRRSHHHHMSSRLPSPPTGHWDANKSPTDRQIVNSRPVEWVTGALHKLRRQERRHCLSEGGRRVRSLPVSPVVWTGGEGGVDTTHTP